MINTLKDVVSVAGALTGGYTLTLLGAQLIEALTGEKITSKSQLEGVIEEESKKLGMQDEIIVGRLYSRDDKRIKGARCYKRDFNIDGKTFSSGVVEIKGGFGATRNVVRHELYHLKNHIPREKIFHNPLLRFLRGFFYEEPTATTYALFGK